MFSLRDSPEFDEWQRFQTEVLRREMNEALERLVRGQSGQEDFKAAIPYARRWLALDPLHEAAHRQLMELYARAGQRAAALHQYSECERILQEELGVPPGLETAALAERIRLESEGQQGQLIKSYELHELIGAGGFGEVYRAYQPQVRREVAVKVILPQYANQPDFIRRFEAEAQMVAQLEHPHIVPLYDFWREPDGAYLVMRWLRGGSLAESLQGGLWSPEATAQLLDQTAAALSLAHQRGIVHRDLKPANILLDESGHAYLSDFGIAKAVTAPASKSEAGYVLASPAYASPETLDDEPLSPQTDIYSLGVILYETLTGGHPFPDTTPPMMIIKHLSEPLPSLRQARPDLPAALDEVIQQATAKKPTDRYADVLALAGDFRRALGSSQVPVTTLPDEATPLLVPNPYKGLHAFQEGDAADFFGRDSLVDQLLIRLTLNRPTTRRSPIANPSTMLRTSPHNFLAIIGPSGSGKSSLVKAGLVPALRQNAIPGSKDWFIVDMTPGLHPLKALETALLRIAINPPPTLLDQLYADERGLLRAVKRILPDEESRLLLVIDQFEEVFTLVEDEATRSRFLDSLYAAVTEPDSPLQVVITLRADFYDRPLLYPGFGDLLRQRMETVLPLSSEELEQAIAGPAERVGATFETGLIPLIVSDVREQPGSLPLMQYALTELYKRRQGRRLTLDGYQASGGVLGALARRADELYTELDDAGRAATRRLFLRLVAVGEVAEDTRRRVLRAELTSLGDVSRTNGQGPGTNAQGESVPGARIVDDNWLMESIIDTFGQYRLLTFDRDPVTRSPTVEVAHEALIREWDRLRQWLDEDREFLMWQQRLRAGLHQWEASEQDEGALLRGAPLVEAENWLNQRRTDLNEAEREFIQAGLALRERQAAEREAQRQRELETARKLAEEAEARLHAEEQHAQEAEARAQEQTLSARRLRWLAVGLIVFLLAAIGAGLFALSQQAVAQRNAAEAQNVALVAGSQAALANDDTDAALSLAWQAASLNPDSAAAQAQLSEAAYAPGTVRRFVGHTDAVDIVAVSPDERTMLSASWDNTLILWDIETGEVLWQFEYSDEINAVAFSPDGRTAISGGKDTTAVLWDVRTGDIIRRFTEYENEIGEVAFSPDGRNILAGGNAADSPIIQWNIETGQVIRRFEGPEGPVGGIEFLPDGSAFLSRSDDGVFILWDFETGDIVRQANINLDEITGGLLAWAISPDGLTAVTGDESFGIILWDLSTGELLGRYEIPGGVNAVTFYPDNNGTVLVSSLGTDSLVTLDLQTGQLSDSLKGHSDAIFDVAMMSNGRYAVTASQDKTVRLWELDRGHVIRRFAPPGALAFEVDLSPDGRTALSASTNGTVTLWDVDTGEMIRQFTDDQPATAVTYSPNGKTALIGTGYRFGEIIEPGHVILWDLETGEEIRRFVGQPYMVFDVEFSPDGKRAVSSGNGPMAILWDVETGQEIHRLDDYFIDNAHPGNTFLNVEFSQDGSTVLVGYQAGPILLWDVETGAEIGQWVGHNSAPIGITFSPDGQKVASGGGDHQVILWDKETGSIIRRFTNHVGSIGQIDFTPDGHLMLGGSGDGTNSLWDVETGEQIRRYGNGRVRMPVFNADGSQALAGFENGAVELWRMDTTLAELLEWTQANRYIPELTCNQRALYKLEPLCTEEAGEAVQESQ
jgi:WD40 repeat protein/serine/threonine protein kinase